MSVTLGASTPQAGGAGASVGPPAGGRTRLSLTRRAPQLLRAHAARDALRLAVLGSADALVLLLLWHTLPGEALRAELSRTADGASGLPFGQLLGAVLLALAVAGAYGAGDRRRDSGAIVGAAGLGSVMALWNRLWGGSASDILAILPPLWLAVAAVLVLERKLVDLLVRVMRPGPGQVMRAVVVGSARHATRLIDHPALGQSAWCDLAAFFDPRRHAAPEAARTLADLIRSRRIDTVILVGRLDRSGFSLALDVAAASGCQVLSLLRVPPTGVILPKVLWRNGYPVVELTRPGLVGAKLLVKRVLDAAAAAVLLVVCAPILAAVAVAVRLTSPGPVLFRQTRIGQGGRRFTILKFRTMVQDAEQQRAALERQSLYRDGRLFKVVNDPRVTRLGAWLRATSLDELPQLWNVLRGDMSLVGPRPPLPREVDLYQEHHYARFDVKPGITGPWQVNGRNTIRDFESVIRLETAYIRHWSIWQDISLLLRTVPVVLSRRGAH